MSRVPAEWRTTFICGGDESPGERGTACPEALHDHPLPSGYVDAGIVAERRLRRGWRNVRCAVCGDYGWIPSLRIAEETGCPVDIVRSLHERLASGKGKPPTAPPVGYRAPGRVVPPQHQDPALVHRVAAAQQQHRTPVPPATHPVSDRWRQAAGHALPDLARAHDAAARLIREIEAALDVAAAHERAAVEKARRDEQLSDAKERLRDARANANECRPAGTSRLVDGRAHPCDHPGCIRVFDTVQGLSLHGRRAHGGAA